MFLHISSVHGPVSQLVLISSTADTATQLDVPFFYAPYIRYLSQDFVHPEEKDFRTDFENSQNYAFVQLMLGAYYHNDYFCIRWGALLGGQLKSPSLKILLLQLNSAELIQSYLIHRGMMTTQHFAVELEGFIHMALFYDNSFIIQGK